MNNFLVGLIGIVVVVGASNLGNLDYPGNLIDDSHFLNLAIRDSEIFPESHLFGHKHITGGAGEGDQFLGEKNLLGHREQVKSDNVLPAYCEPPNPCPVGLTGVDGCLEEFENTAEFSRNYQAQQECLCDQEHMFNCPEAAKHDADEDYMNMDLAEDGIDKKTVAKKSPPPFVTGEEAVFRRKRSIPEYVPKQKVNPYLQGEPLRSMSKKDGKSSWE
uniref:Neuroendocrine protein 7B2 n=1 Tax=Rhabditophanes sp. KR3021 TaxID=114890 RepID=A0AC35UF08_9BILA